MRGKSIFVLLILLVSSPFWGCSSEGVVCGDSVCNSGEVCEGGVCVLGLSFDDVEGDEGCEGDVDCSGTRVCTLPGSEPSNTCIPRLHCDSDIDCQSGLSCEEDGICR